MPASQLKARWKAGEAAYGVAIRLDTTWTVEAAARSELDFIWFDMQHGFIADHMLLPMLQAMNGSSATSLVRVPSNDPVLIGRVLDAGAEGIIIPMVESAQDAERAIAACRFGTQGIRSNGALRLQFLGGIHRDVICLMMVETVKGTENAHEIASVPGVDGIFIGPSDLALSMGLEPTGIQGGEHAAAINRILQACNENGVVACITGDGQAMREQGFLAISIGADHLFFASGLKAALSRR